MELELVNYSEKAFAVIGNTKPIKDKLKELGGKFNPKLNCGAGWIFSKKKLAAVEEALNVKMVGANDDEVESKSTAAYVQAQEEAYFENLNRRHGYEQSEDEIEEGFFNREAGYEG